MRDLKENSYPDRGVNLALVYFLASLILSGLILSFGPVATDQAAHFHLQEIFNRHGFTLWDNTWYLGRYSFVNYSFAFYAIAHFIGLKTTAAVSVATSTALVSMLVDRHFPNVLSGAKRLSLLVISLMVLNGAWPFLLGVAFLLLALLMYGERRRVMFSLLGLLTLLSSPLALLALLMVIAAIEVPFHLLDRGIAVFGVIKRVFSSWYFDVSVVLGLIQLLSMRVFPDHGFYPYWWSDLLVVEVFSAVCFVLIPKGFPHRETVLALIVIYALVNLAAFVIKTNLGSNAARIVDFAFPIVVVLATQRKGKQRAISATLIVLALIWNLVPILPLFSSSLQKTSNPKFWTILKPSLVHFVVPGSRVELVDTANHEGDYYLPKMGFSLVRGWFRQDDFPNNSLLYEGHYTPSQYRRWLVSSGASVVVVPPGPYDFSSVNEANLLLSGKSGLKHLATVNGIEIFAVGGKPSIVRGPNGNYVAAKVGVNSLSITSTQPGTYQLSLHYSPYWSSTSGTICKSSDGMTTWKISRSGSNRLEFNATLGKVASVLVGDSSPACY